MRRTLQLALVMALVAASAAGAEVIERIVAKVNSHPILSSELDEALRYQCLLDGKPLDGLSGDDRKQALDRLVDRALIEQQMNGATYPRVTPEEVAKRLAEIRAQLPDGGSDEAWRAALLRYRLSDEDVAEQLSTQLDVLRFVELKFRPNIQVDRRAIQDYYLQHLIPELHKRGAREVPLNEVSDQIRELLVQQRIDELLSAWLVTLRAQAEVELP